MQIFNKLLALLASYMYLQQTKLMRLMVELGLPRMPQDPASQIFLLVTRTAMSCSTSVITGLLDCHSQNELLRVVAMLLSLKGDCNGPITKQSMLIRWSNVQLHSHYTQNHIRLLGWDSVFKSSCVFCQQELLPQEGGCCGILCSSSQINEQGR